MAQRQKIPSMMKNGAAGATSAPAKASRARAREATRYAGCHMPEGTWSELDDIVHARRRAGEEGGTMQALMLEAVEDVINKHRGSRGGA